MSKKLLSFVLVVAMVMSLFCVAFPTVAAAADDDAPAVTYYFLSPETADEPGTPNAYWWIPSEAAGWPGQAMTAAPAVGKNVYKIDAKADTLVIIFNGSFGQTKNISLTKNKHDDAYTDGTGLNNVSNMIFVTTGMVDGQYTGAWFSLDPASEDYYRNSDAYKALGFEEGAATETPAYDSSIECKAYPKKVTPENMVETKFTFEPSGDFSNYSRMCFYIWDETNGAQLDKNGQWWQNVNFWGSKSNIGVTANDDGVYEYTAPIPEGHSVFVIVHAFNSDPQLQTCNVILTKDADGDTLYITGNLLENPVDSNQAPTIEAKFRNTEKCGPAKVVTSTCKVIGTVLQGDAAVMLATGIKNYYTDTENWTRENVKKAEEALGVTDAQVQAELDKLLTGDALAKASELLKDAVETKEEPTPETKDEPTPETKDEPTPDETKDEPTPDETKDEPTPDETKDEPTPVDTKDEPTPVDTKDEPTPVDTKDEPTPVDTKDEPTPVDTKDEPKPDDPKPDDPKPDDPKPDDPKPDDPKPDDPKPEVVKIGDVDGDGAVNSGDALAILRASLDPDSLTDEQKKVYDVNGDGVVNSEDALIVLRYSVGIVDENTQKIIDIFGAAK